MIKQHNTSTTPSSLSLLKRCMAAFMATLMLGLTAYTPVSATTNAQVANAQRIMRKYGLTLSAADGVSGARTVQGLCAFRYITGLPVTRAALDSATYTKLVNYDKTYSSLSNIPTRITHKGELLIAHKTCQTMFYSRYNSSTQKVQFIKVMMISTATSQSICGEKKNQPCNTPNGSDYELNYTQIGWSCSTEYGNGCRNHTEGALASKSRYGNMYNFRGFTSSGHGIHGSLDVPAYPASHGCIRVSIADSDWMYNNVGNGTKPRLIVTGKF